MKMAGIIDEAVVRRFYNEVRWATPKYGNKAKSAVLRRWGKMWGEEDLAEINRKYLNMI